MSPSSRGPGRGPFKARDSDRNMPDSTEWQDRLASFARLSQCWRLKARRDKYWRSAKTRLEDAQALDRLLADLHGLALRVD